VRRLSDSPLIAEHRRVGPAVFAFTTRHGGVSAPPHASLNLGFHVGDDADSVSDNRRRALAAVGAGRRRLVEAEQVHGARVAVVTRDWLAEQTGERAIAPGADALVTQERGVVLALFFADCVPVFVADDTASAIGLVHAGWRGTAARCAASAVATMAQAFAVSPAALHAVVGPCVGVCCYEVGPEIAAAVEGSVASPRGLLTLDGETLRLDLARANALQLMEAGVPEARIEIIPRCTCCENDTFFSVRGDGPTTGRSAALAWHDR
jgi:YfiH family protein